MTDVWSALAAQEKPIVLYGMGNGADKILSVFSSLGIKISGVFASDGFARGNLYAGFPVVTYSDMCAKFDDFTVVVAFASSRREVIDNVKKIASERELLIPDVPVAGDGLFNAEFVTSNSDKLRQARDSFADERSREVFDLVCRARLTGDPQALFDCADEPECVWRDILRPSKYRSFVDVGAYVGDSLCELAAIAPLEQVRAIEPDSHSFKKLTAELQKINAETEAVNAAAWDSTGVILEFADGAGRGSGVGARSNKIRRVPSVTVDSLLGKNRADYIKYDVEGAEMRALLGSVNTLRNSAPDLRVALYHRPEDIFEIPLFLRSILPNHKFYLRRAPSFPAWDLDLFAVSM